MPTKKRIKISITKKSDGRYKVTIDPVSQWIKTGGEEVVWTSDKADLSVNFNKNGCPFSSAAFFGPKGTDLCASAEPVNTTERSYAYSITITPNPAIGQGPHGNLAPIVLDPEVVIDESGPPGGKKAAKKKAAKKKPAKKKAARKAAKKR